MGLFDTIRTAGNKLLSYVPPIVGNKVVGAIANVKSSIAGGGSLAGTILSGVQGLSGTKATSKKAPIQTFSQAAQLVGIPVSAAKATSTGVRVRNAAGGFTTTTLREQKAIQAAPGAGAVAGSSATGSTILKAGLVAAGVAGAGYLAEQVAEAVGVRGGAGFIGTKIGVRSMISRRKRLIPKSVTKWLNKAISKDKGLDKLAKKFVKLAKPNLFKSGKK